jgi:flagellar hook-basal body complex protein FliE
MSGISGIGGGGFSNAAGLREIMQLRQQIIDKSQVLQQVHSGQSQTGATQSSQDSGGFTGTLKNALGAVNASQNRAEQMTAAYETGQTQDVAKVMLARQEASVGFEATLQVRNKLLSAYQDIMKMGV